MTTKILSTFACILSAISLTACSEDTFGPDPAKDWAGTTSFFNSTDDKGFLTYYTPTIGRCGDPMPFYDQNEEEFKVLYLQEYDNNGPCYHPIWGVSTKDGANYESLGEVIPTGQSIYEADAALGTGCAVYNEQDGLYYIYYTGHTAKEVVMRATSPDFKTWTKDNAWMLEGADYGYSEKDFRDPQVFKTDDGQWHMIISSNLKFAEFKSTDLKNWEHVGQFNMFWGRMLECPDVFKMGNKWYLVYSEALREPWSRKVKYVMADSWDGLKSAISNPNFPADGKEGVLDSRAFYAGKTASNGTDRYIWGWCPYRIGATLHDKNINVGAQGEPAWSGALVCHRIIQHEDGTLTLGEVPAFDEKYDDEQVVAVMDSHGYNDGVLSGDDAYVLFNRLGYQNHISMTIKTSNNWDKFGISFVRSTDPDFYYTMVVNPEWEDGRKINFEQEGYRITINDKGEEEKEYGKGFVEGIDGYVFARPADNTYHIDIYTDNSVMVMYINDNVCYTQRIYGIQKNCWSINNYGGTITISDVEVSWQ